MTYSDEQLAEYREVFAFFDRQQTGEIHLSELGLILRSIGFNPSERLIQQIQNEQRGTRLDLQQFLQILIDLSDEIEDEINLIEAFRVFDKEGQGFIPREELLYIITHFGETFSLEEAEEMLDDADIYCDGKIRYEEFVRIITQFN